jgi:hypothetical protein
MSKLLIELEYMTKGYKLNENGEIRNLKENESEDEERVKQFTSILSIMMKICKSLDKEIADSDPKKENQERKPTQNNKSLVPKMHILHLSDLHFGTLEQARIWSNQLAQDLKVDLKIFSLDALILSGDIANKSIGSEYEAAQKFLDYFQATAKRGDANIPRNEACTRSVSGER